MTTVETYLNQRELAELLGVSRRLVNQRWNDEQGVFPPDVRVGKILGWSRARGMRFGAAAGLLTARGALIPRRPHDQVVDPSPEAAEEMRVTTRVYLSQEEVAAVWARSTAKIIQLRKARRFPEPVVRISRVCGWTKEQIIREGQQTGRVDRNGNAVPVPH